jgi:transposase-like protein
VSNSDFADGPPPAPRNAWALRRGAQVRRHGSTGHGTSAPEVKPGLSDPFRAPNPDASGVNDRVPCPDSGRIRLAPAGRDGATVADVAHDVRGGAPPVVRAVAESDDSAPVPGDESEHLLHTVRDRRAALGRVCPHCATRAAIRWGSFAGRQRYRCRNCRRTFSDLTGTPLACTKRLSQWPGYLRRLDLTEPVRRTAEILRLHPCTAFRWRHIALDALHRDRVDVVLGGEVQLHTGLIRLGMKGTRTHDAHDESTAVERRRLRRLESWAPVHFLIACDRSGDVIPVVMAQPWLSRDDLEKLFASRIAEGTLLVVTRRWWSSRRDLTAASRACALQLEFSSDFVERGPPTGPHVRDASSHGRRFLRWLRRFRGVARHYIRNYLEWHVLLDADVTRSADGDENGGAYRIVPDVLTNALGAARPRSFTHPRSG